jgi:hypothetical protein
MPFSVAKPMVAVCAHLLVDRGVLALDRPVARDWPEFAAAGKAEITLRQVLSHQAGVTLLDEPVPSEAMLDWDRITRALAAARPASRRAARTASARASTATWWASSSAGPTAAASAAFREESPSRSGSTSTSGSTGPSWRAAPRCSRSAQRTPPTSRAAAPAGPRG